MEDMSEIYEARIEKLNNEIQSLKFELSNRRNTEQDNAPQFGQNSLYENRISSLKSQIDFLRKNRDQLINHIQRLEAQLEIIDHRSEDQQNQIKNLIQHNEFLQREASRLNNSKSNGRSPVADSFEVKESKSSLILAMDL